MVALQQVFLQVKIPLLKSSKDSLPAMSSPTPFTLKVQWGCHRKKPAREERSIEQDGSWSKKLGTETEITILCLQQDYVYLSIYIDIDIYSPVVRYIDIYSPVRYIDICLTFKHKRLSKYTDGTEILWSSFNEKSPGLMYNCGFESPSHMDSYIPNKGWDFKLQRRLRRKLQPLCVLGHIFSFII